MIEIGERLSLLEAENASLRAIATQKHEESVAYYQQLQVIASSSRCTNWCRESAAFQASVAETERLQREAANAEERVARATKEAARWEWTTVAGSIDRELTVMLGRSYWPFWMKLGGNT